MNRRLRTDRMRERAKQVRVSELLRTSGEEVREQAASGWLPPAFLDAGSVTDEQVAEWQARWDETMRDHERRPRYIVLPGRTAVRPSRPRKSTPRGLPRMREHTRTLLLNALRGDGTPRSAARIAICRAYRVLPDEIGITDQADTNGATDQ